MAVSVYCQAIWRIVDLYDIYCSFISFNYDAGIITKEALFVYKFNIKFV